MKIKILIISILAIKSFGTGFPNYYYDIKSVKKQKEDFIKILLPLVEKTNKTIENEREFVKAFFKVAIKNTFRGLDKKSLKKLIFLYKKYDIKGLFAKKEYLIKIDIVPTSLALAQAAIESGWGKSRFVREANNIFGHWTYSGVGLIPNERGDGQIHRIRIFDSLQSSVNAYVLNLNRHEAYKEFRKKRLEAHQKGEIYNGIMASKTMIYYSQQREKYVKKLDNVINKNNLLYYDAYNPATFIDSA